MKTMIAQGLIALLALGAASVAHAQSTPATVFSCKIGKKTVSVTQADGLLTYHFGTGKKDEMTIVGTPGNVFQMSQRYAGMEYQVRFKRGDFSYIVFNSEGNGNVGAEGSSGLVVMQDTKLISDHFCTRYTEFTVSIDSLGIAEDTADYSAM
jgi:uncharacterized protein YaiE (UPF0345 family)